MPSKLNSAYQLIRNGYFTVFLNELKKRIYSHSVSFGLQRDLNDEFRVPKAKIEIQVRPFRKNDLIELLDTTDDPSINPRIIAGQKGFVNAKIPTCYVAVTAENKPCFMQWLIGYDDNQRIEKYFKGAFPELKKSEALLEGAFSNPSYRGLRIMPRAMALIAEKATDLNARWVNTYVDITNIPSLKGCQRAGFNPFQVRKERWFLFHRTITFHPLTVTMNQLFYDLTGSDRSITGDIHQKPLSNHEPKSISTFKTGASI